MNKYMTTKQLFFSSLLHIANQPIKIFIQTLPSESSSFISHFNSGFK